VSAAGRVEHHAHDRRTAERGFPTLGASKLPVHILPGNHDKYLDRWGTPNCMNFQLKFEHLMPNFNSDIGHWINMKQGVRLGFIYADFCLLERGDARDKIIGAYGQGRVYADILNELKERTLTLRSKYPGIQLVWLMHFAPFDCGYGLELIDWSDIEQTAISLRVAATLCGHTHRGRKSVRDDHVIYCGGSAACVDSEEDIRVHIIHFDVDNKCGVSRESYRWNAEVQEFQLFLRD
jgi:hypothetical protein